MKKAIIACLVAVAGAIPALGRASNDLRLDKFDGIYDLVSAGYYGCSLILELKSNDPNRTLSYRQTSLQGAQNDYGGMHRDETSPDELMRNLEKQTWYQLFDLDRTDRDDIHSFKGHQIEMTFKWHQVREHSWSTEYVSGGWSKKVKNPDSEQGRFYANLLSDDKWNLFGGVHALLHSFTGKLDWYGSFLSCKYQRRSR